MRTMKNLAIAAFAASALTLAGCGGGGGGSSSSGEPPAPPAPKMVSLPDNVPTGMTPGAGTHTIAAGATMDNNGVTFACAAGGDACTVMVAADGSATYTGGTVTASLSQAAQTAIDNANQVADADKMKEDDAAKANSATAKALKAAIDIAKFAADGSTAVPSSGPGAITPTSIPVLDADGAASTNEASEVDTVAITLKKGDAVGSLGSWGGTDYAGMEAATGAAAKNTGMVRVYSNQGAAKSVTFASEAGNTIHGWDATSGDPVGDYTVVTTTAAQQKAVGGFPTTGTTSYEDDDTVPEASFMGASGTYECTAATCTSTVTADGIDLGTGWTFTPAAGATLQQPDARYLQFGWWLRKDKDGPTHAGAFYGVVTPTANSLAAYTGINNAALIGEATYEGAAAGKFAISDPLRPADDNAGHFTADATLNADFKSTGSTLAGTIDGFRLNDGSDDPGWSVELQKAGFTSPNFGTGATPDGDQTVWSINGAKGAASGSWQAQMFDENASDDSNVPTSVIGSFNSQLGSTHSLVGAFGAEKQD